jgi:hypothetical protein
LKDPLFAPIELCRKRRRIISTGLRVAAKGKTHMVKELDLHAIIDRHVTEVLSGASSFQENLKTLGNADQRSEMTATRLALFGQCEIAA